MEHTAAGAAGQAWRGATRSDVVLDGQPVATAVEGPSEASRTLVAVHGLRGTHQGLRHLTSALADEGVRVLSPDLPGMGITPVHGEAPRLDDLAGLVVALAQQCEQPPTLLGHSFGATVACAAAARSPQSFRRLVLVSPVAVCSARRRDPANRAVTAATDLWCRAIVAMPVPLAVAWCDRPGRGWFSNRVLAQRGAAGRRRVLERSREVHEHHTDPVAAARSQWDATHHDCGEFAARIGLPTTIVAGDADPISPLPLLQDLSRTFRDARLHLLPGAGHLAHHEDTEAIAAVVSAALEEDR